MLMCVIYMYYEYKHNNNSNSFTYLSAVRSMENGLAVKMCSSLHKGIKATNIFLHS
jgi:hypothetical protein